MECVVHTLLIVLLTSYITAAEDKTELTSTADWNSSGLNALQDLIHRYSQNHKVSKESDDKSGAGREETPNNELGLDRFQFESMLVSTTQHSEEFVHQVMGPCLIDEDRQHVTGKIKVTNCTWKAECPGTDEIFRQYAVNTSTLDASGLLHALPLAMNTLTDPYCTSRASSLKDKLYHVKDKRTPTTMETWLYGTGFCSLVVVISNIGAFLGPCMESPFFKRLLQFLVSMGAGSLASTGLLVLIPEAFDLMSVQELKDTYLSYATVAMLSIFTFFCSERVLKTFIFNRNRKSKELSVSVSTPSPDDDLELYGDHLLGDKFNNTNNHNKGRCRDNGDGCEKAAHLISPKSQENGHGHSHGGRASDLEESEENRTTLAWMVMAGDVIHNFVDGLSVGAAFTEDLSLGISVSLAILCEELPHELADIAILLHSGLSIKRAVFINFLSACVCYIGLVLGIFLGTTIHSSKRWIFAMAGGLFLYVPLVDMLPDMSAHLDQLLTRGGNEAKVVAALHLLGLLVGTGIIIFIVNITGFINLE